PWGEGFPGWHIECSAMSAKYLGEQFDIHGGGMDLQFPHHESEIAQSCICHHGKMMARYWLHNNMITINGRKMGKSYNNVIKLTELFSGNHPLLEQAYHPMTVRFFIMQSHYRSTLDFSNEALQASEKAFKRLWEAYENLERLVKSYTSNASGNDNLDKKIIGLITEFDEFMNDDLNTAKVLANMFEIVPIINGLKGGQINKEEISTSTLTALYGKMKVWMEDIFGLQNPTSQTGDDGKLSGVMQVLIEIRRQAKARKDWATSDAIRNQLAAIGVQLKDEKDGSVTWTV
nr:cysteine--tRNA ligase [Chitinophagaceae bacterium]